jgi:hypothetical protein
MRRSMLAMSWIMLLPLWPALGRPGDSTEPPPEKKPDLLAIAFDQGISLA